MAATHPETPQILKETVEVVSLVPHVQISERFCEPIGEVAVPQVAEQLSHVRRTCCGCASASVCERER